MTRIRHFPNSGQFNISGVAWDCCRNMYTKRQSLRTIFIQRNTKCDQIWIYMSILDEPISTCVNIRLSKNKLLYHAISRHGIADSTHPNTGIGNHNYCRNPDDEPGAWCYTTDPNYRWDLCICPSK